SLSLFRLYVSRVFLFTGPATTAIYPLSLHAALPISALAAAGHGSATTLLDLCRRLVTRRRPSSPVHPAPVREVLPSRCRTRVNRDRKSTRLNSSHQISSYAVFCLKKKNTTTPTNHSE